jgi:hypothetical protein
MPSLKTNSCRHARCEAPAVASLRTYTKPQPCTLTPHHTCAHQRQFTKPCWCAHHTCTHVCTPTPHPHLHTRDQTRAVRTYATPHPHTRDQTRAVRTYATPHPHTHTTKPEQCAPTSPRPPLRPHALASLEQDVAKRTMSRAPSACHDCLRALVSRVCVHAATICCHPSFRMTDGTSAHFCFTAVAWKWSADCDGAAAMVCSTAHCALAFLASAATVTAKPRCIWHLLMT